MSNSETISADVLSRRLKYFFSSSYRGRVDAHETISELRKLGRVGLIGGMLRDLTLFNNLEFTSDIDLVIDPWNLSSFENHMDSIGAAKNRFGGYSLPSSRWQVDIWPLEKTWANVEGHVQVRSFNDLRKVTFFSCDAIIYDVSNARFLSDQDYFEKLQKGTMDINLKPNPNPVGNVVRAFRYAFLKNLKWEVALTNFVLEIVNSVEWSDLVAKEHNAHRTHFIANLDELSFKKHLSNHCFELNSKPFDPTKFYRPTQLDLAHTDNERAIA